MKRALWLGVLPLALSVSSFGSSCGTIASPTTCSITVGGTNTFTVSGFNLVTASATGGGNVYDGTDFDIDISSGGGLTLLMTFSKHAAANGVVFLANSGQTASFIFQYNVALSPAVAGTTTFTAPDAVSFPQSSASGTGLSTSQMILSDGQNGTSCQAIRNSGGLTQGNCNTLPANLAAVLQVSNIVSLTGNTGNTSVLSLSNLIDSSFTAGAAATPEPSTYALVGLSLAGLGLLRRRR